MSLCPPGARRGGQGAGSNGDKLCCDCKQGGHLPNAGRIVCTGVCISSEVDSDLDRNTRHSTSSQKAQGQFIHAERGGSYRQRGYH